jgi:serine/threonine-protein kinase
LTEQHEHRDDRIRPGSLLSNRYELLDRIGSGASAITWRARDQRLERIVAIKVLRPTYALDPTFAQRFDREARTAASISHGNVVDIYDVGKNGDVLYLVMQYVQGRDLKELIEQEGPLAPERARAIALQVLAGLQEIHRAGIIHRDIKPQNVLIGQDDVARVTDFGVAQVALDSSLTTAGTTVGTAAYMAPEQAKAENLSEATDLYAVGVMLYEMLTATLPFSGATPMALMLAHIQQHPVPPSHVDPDLRIPASFDGVVMQAMAKLPEDRFRSAQAMSRALAGAAMSADSATRTVLVPAANRTQAAPAARQQRSGAWPAPQPSPDLDWARQSTGRRAVVADRERSGVRAALWGLLFLIVLMLGAIGVYAYNEYVAEDNNNSPPVPTQTAEAEPTATVDEDDDQQVIVPDDRDDPTDEPQPTDEPVATDEPTAEPTDEPMPTDEPPSTDEPTIGPVDSETSIVIGPDATEAPGGDGV